MSSAWLARLLTLLISLALPPSAHAAAVSGATPRAARPAAHLGHDGADLLVHRAAQAQPVHHEARQAQRAQARQHDHHDQPRRRACSCAVGQRPHCRLGRAAAAWPARGQARCLWLRTLTQCLLGACTQPLPPLRGSLVPTPAGMRSRTQVQGRHAVGRPARRARPAPLDPAPPLQMPVGSSHWLRSHLGVHVVPSPVKQGGQVQTCSGTSVMFFLPSFASVCAGPSLVTRAPAKSCSSHTISCPLLAPCSCPANMHYKHRAAAVAFAANTRAASSQTYAAWCVWVSAIAARSPARRARLVHVDVVLAGVERARLAVDREVTVPAAAVALRALVLQVRDAPGRTRRRARTGCGWVA
jgi:hypothetical protein